MWPKITVIVPFYNSEDTLERALNSIPMAKDIQLILLDDGSTDGSWQVALDWWRKRPIEGTASVIHRWDKNKGVAATMNLGFEMAKGQWIVSLSSDDWYLTDFEKFRPLLTSDRDLVFFDLEVNDGSVWHLDEKSMNEYVGAVKFIRREFLGKTRIPDLKWHEDKPFSNELYKKGPRCEFTGIVLKHYNWPREGSLIWQASQDEYR